MVPCETRSFLVSQYSYYSQPFRGTDWALWASAEWTGPCFCSLRLFLVKSLWWIMSWLAIHSWLVKLDTLLETNKIILARGWMTKFLCVNSRLDVSTRGQFHTGVGWSMLVSKRATVDGSTAGSYPSPEPSPGCRCCAMAQPWWAASSPGDHREEPWVAMVLFTHLSNPSPWLWRIIWFCMVL